MLQEAQEQAAQRRRSSDDGMTGVRSAAARCAPSQSRATAQTANRTSAPGGVAPAVDIYSFLLAPPQLPAAAKQGSSPAPQPAGTHLASPRPQPQPAPVDALHEAPAAAQPAAAACPQLVTVKQRQAPISPFACASAPAVVAPAKSIPIAAAAPSPAACAAPPLHSAELPKNAADGGKAAVGPASGDLRDHAAPAQQQQPDAVGAFMGQLARVGGKLSL